MSAPARVLVVANRTADSEEVLAALVGARSAERDRGDGADSGDLGGGRPPRRRPDSSSSPDSRAHPSSRRRSPGDRRGGRRRSIPRGRGNLGPGALRRGRRGHPAAARLALASPRPPKATGAPHRPFRPTRHRQRADPSSARHLQRNLVRELRSVPTAPTNPAPVGAACPPQPTQHTTAAVGAQTLARVDAILGENAATGSTNRHPGRVMVSVRRVGAATPGPRLGGAYKGALLWPSAHGGGTRARAHRFWRVTFHLRPRAPGRPCLRHAADSACSSEAAAVTGASPGTRRAAAFVENESRMSIRRDTRCSS